MRSPTKTLTSKLLEGTLADRMDIRFYQTEPGVWCNSALGIVLTDRADKTLRVKHVDEAEFVGKANRVREAGYVSRANLVGSAVSVVSAVSCLKIETGKNATPQL